MTSGAPEGTSGVLRKAFWTSLALLASLNVAFCVVNSLTVLRDFGGAGRDLDWWEPWLWESSSGVVSIALAPLIWLVLRREPPGEGRWLRFAAVHLSASMVVSIAHVTGFTAIRIATYAALGGDYDYGSVDDYIYEYRKDVLGYVLSVGLMWTVTRSFLSRHAASAAAQAPATFDIRDGAGSLRVRIDEIVSVTAAGNYVEFRLIDGGAPLMRATLSQIEAQLTPRGLVRTHRSWLVNPARVRAITPEGSGDFTVDLEGGTSAPLSRRFPEALERLRQPQGTAGAA